MTEKKKVVDENKEEFVELKDDSDFAVESFAPKFRINKNHMESSKWKIATKD
jgi:hypothetical protein